MPLIRSAITWSTEKVSGSLKNHQENHVEDLPTQDVCNTTSKHSLSCEDRRDLAAEHYSDSNDPLRLNENVDTEQEPTSPNSDFHSKWTPPPPPSSNPTQTPEPKQITSNEINHPDAIYHSQSPTLLQQTPTHPPPAQSRSTIPPQYTGPASEDRNRADYYQAKYYESQRLQGQYQGQSAQYGDDCGMVSHQQQQSGEMRRGGGGGRGRGRRGRGGSGLIGMLLKH
jgi:hypothetical protein